MIMDESKRHACSATFDLAMRCAPLSPAAIDLERVQNGAWFNRDTGHVEAIKGAWARARLKWFKLPVSGAPE